VWREQARGFLLLTQADVCSSGVTSWVKNWKLNGWRSWPQGNLWWWLDGASSNRYRVVIRAISWLSCSKTMETSHSTPTCYSNIWYWQTNWDSCMMCISVPKIIWQLVSLQVWQCHRYNNCIVLYYRLAMSREADLCNLVWRAIKG